MIPKILHFVWLSGSTLPPDIEACLDSWKKHFPDYEIKYWTKNDVDEIKLDYVAQAIEVKKWAFATDYIRLYALYHYGGIYMDSDVMVRKNFDFALQNRFFSAIESYPEDIEVSLLRGDIDEYGNKLKDIPYILGVQIQAAIMGAEKGHPFLKDCMDYYDNHVFLDSGGNPSMDMISPYIYANAAVKYGFKFVDKEQELLEGIKLYPVELFAPSTGQALPESYAVHCCKGSWRESGKEQKHDKIPSLPIVKRRINGLISATKVMSAYDCMKGCNDFIFVRFLVYMAKHNLWLYRLYMLKISCYFGLQLAKKIHDGVCYYRSVNPNLYKRFKQSISRC